MLVLLNFSREEQTAWFDFRETPWAIDQGERQVRDLLTAAAFPTLSEANQNPYPISLPPANNRHLHEYLCRQDRMCYKAAGTKC